MTLVLAASACAPPRYVPPSPTEPHATVVVRVVHHAISGRDLLHRTLIDGRRVDHGARQAVVQGTPLTRTVRVRPAPTRWRFHSQFSHTQQTLQTVYESERYPCGTQTSGYGRSAYTSTRYCTRQVPRQRWRTVRVTDGECQADLLQTPRVDRRYVVTFDYYGHAACRARCFEQTPLAGGRFRLTPCGLRADPATIAAAPADRRSASSPDRRGPASAPPSSGGEAGAAVRLSAP